MQSPSAMSHCGKMSPSEDETNELLIQEKKAVLKRRSGETVVQSGYLKVLL